jgi:hypothetical protein
MKGSPGIHHTYAISTTIGAWPAVFVRVARKLGLICCGKHLGIMLINPEWISFCYSGSLPLVAKMSGQKNKPWGIQGLFLDRHIFEIRKAFILFPGFHNIKRLWKGIPRPMRKAIAFVW